MKSLGLFCSTHISVVLTASRKSRPGQSPLDSRCGLAIIIGLVLFGQLMVLPLNPLLFNNESHVLNVSSGGGAFISIWRCFSLGSIVGAHSVPNPAVKRDCGTGVVSSWLLFIAAAPYL